MVTCIENVIIITKLQNGNFVWNQWYYKHALLTDRVLSDIAAVMKTSNLVYIAVVYFPSQLNANAPAQCWEV